MIVKRRALFLSPESPYPMAGGGALRSASVLEYLSRNYQVDVITFHQPDDPPPGDSFPPGRAERLRALELPRHSRRAWARAIRNARRLLLNRPPLLDRFAGFDEPIAEFIAGRNYEVAVVEHFWCAPYGDLLRPNCRLLALDLHNIESVWHQRLARSSGFPVSFAHHRFARACQSLEKTWLPRFDVLLAASESDGRILQPLAGRARVAVYPNAIPPNAIPESEPRMREEQDAIIFTGNMEYQPNISAVRFFRDRIWSLLRHRWPDLKWRIAGKNPRAVARLVRGDPRIELVGPIEDAVAEIARAKVAVVPLLTGSGTRVKILEAWAAATPVVSTTLGAEGLDCEPGVHLLIDDDPANFAKAVSDLLGSPECRTRMGQAGRQLCRDRYTWEAAWNGLDRAFGK
jgi:polysaccharide biosynthesis protein PslH